MKLQLTYALRALVAASCCVSTSLSTCADSQYANNCYSLTGLAIVISALSVSMQGSVTEPAATARTHASSPATLCIAFEAEIQAYRVPHRLRPALAVPRSLILATTMDERCS